jgi:tyrosinase
VLIQSLHKKLSTSTIMANFSKPQSMVTMLFALFALLQVTVASQHGAHHHAHRNVVQSSEIKSHIDEVNEALAKRQNSQLIATSGVCSTGTVRSGACNSNGRQSSPRLEIRTLQRNADQWNLYLLGMERFQGKSKDDVLSYYQVAGVHGRPFTTWNKFPAPLLNNAGFCPHGSTLFGSWHRPYLAIYEVCIA